MNLYVWDEDCLTDYTDGMIVAVANSLEEAVRAIDLEHFNTGNYPHMADTYSKYYKRDKPNHVVPIGETPFSFLTWGGG